MLKIEGIGFIRSFFLTLAIVAICAALFFTQARAVDVDTSLHLTISPPLLSLTTTPNTTTTAEIKVKNDGSKSEHLQLNLEKFTSEDENGKPTIAPPDPQDDFIKWITFSQNVFDLVPGEQKTVTATFKIPKEAAFGYYYSIEFVRAAPNAGDSPTSSRVAGAAATLVLLNVDVPNAKREVQVVEFSPSSSFFEFLPAKLNVRLKNNGNVHAAPRGNVFIDRGDHQSIATLEVNQEKGYILPGTKRAFQTSWTDGFPFYQQKIKDGKPVFDNNGNPEMELKWDFSKLTSLRFGQYQAHLLMVYDDGHRDIPIEATTSFWIIPWRLILGGLLILMAPFVLGFIIARLLIRR